MSVRKNYTVHKKGFGDNTQTIVVDATHGSNDSSMDIIGTSPGASAPYPSVLSTPMGSVASAAMASYTSSMYSSVPTVVHPFTKEKYSEVVKNKRREFVHLHFSKELETLFASLSEDAEKMKQCHREIKFEVPEMFSVEKAETILTAYFSDLGYKPLVERRGEDEQVIIITIT